MDIGQKIKLFRNKQNITQKQLAVLIGKSKSSIEKYEAGKISPGIGIINDIADALSINVIDLIDEDSFKVDHRMDRDDLANILNINLDSANKEDMDKLENTKSLIDEAYKKSFELIEKGNLCDEGYDPYDIEMNYKAYIAKITDTYELEIKCYKEIIQQYKEMTNKDKKIIDMLISKLGHR